MKRTIILIGAIIISLSAAAQEQELAKAAYQEAADALKKKDYKSALSSLDRCETLLGDPTVKTTRLKAQALRQAAFSDSTQYYAQYIASVKTFEDLARQKGLDAASVNEITGGVKTFSTDKRRNEQEELNTAVAAWPATLFGVSIGMAEADAIAAAGKDMEQSKENPTLWTRRHDDPHTPGLSEVSIVSGKVVRIVAYTDAGSKKEAMAGANKYKEITDKLYATFGDAIKGTAGRDEVAGRAVQGAQYTAKVNPHCRYTAKYCWTGNYSKWFIYECYEAM